MGSIGIIITKKLCNKKLTNEHKSSILFLGAIFNSDGFHNFCIFIFVFPFNYTVA